MCLDRVTTTRPKESGVGWKTKVEYEDATVEGVQDNADVGIADKIRITQTEEMVCA